MSLTALLVALALAQPGPQPGEIDADVLDEDGGPGALDASTNWPDASVSPNDASVNLPDASVPPVAGMPWPRPASLSLGAGTFVAAWESPLRDDAFGSDRGRGADLWSNGWRVDGGTVEPWGQIVCPAAKGERFSEPRVAWTGTDFVYAWRVEKVGASGHALRTARVTPTGVTSGCADFVENGGVGVTSLGLAAAGATVLAVWETASDVRGKFLGAPGSFVILQKSATDAFVRPSVTALDTGFQVLWLEGTTPVTRSIAPTGALGTPTTLGVSAKHATVTGAATATAVYVEAELSGGTTVSPLMAMDLGFASVATTLRAYTTDAPPLAARGGAFLFAAHVPYAGAPAAEVVQRGLMTPTSIPNGDQPEAMASGEQRAGLLVHEGEAWRVYALPALANANGPTLAPLEPTRLGSWQQLPTTAWVPPEGWVVTWFDGRNRAASGAVIGTDGGFRGLPSVADAGVPRMVSATAEGLAGVALFTENETRLYALTAAALPVAAATPRLEVPGEQSATALGAHLAAGWSPATGTFWWKGTGNAQKAEYGGGLLGRCGAFANGHLWVPVLGVPTGGRLGLLRLDDSEQNASAAPVPVALPTSVGAASSLPCLATNGTRGLVAWSDGSQKLVLVTIDLAGATPAAEFVPLPSGSLKARDPVVAAISGGWVVAWELEDTVRSQVQSVTVSLAGEVSAVTTWSTAADARSPALASGPTGDALLAFHQFHPELGAALVKHKVLPGLAKPDAGVSDAGTATGDAGQGGDDAGVAPGDGGSGGGGGGSLNEPVDFSSCGCATDGASLLAALALATLRRRRR